MSVVFRILDRVLEAMLVVTLAGMVAVVATNVFCRFVLHFSFSWGDETAQILMVWLTFLGAAVATRDRAHFAFDYLIRNLPQRAKKFFVVLGHLIVLAMTLGLLYWSGKVTWEIRHWVMPATDISRSWVYGACPTGCVFILLYAAQNFLTDLFARQVESAEEEVLI